MDFPTVEFSARERAAGKLDQTTFDKTWELFDRWGSVRILGLFEPELMAAMARHYRARYADKLIDTKKEDRRPLFTPTIAGPFADRRYHSNPLLFPLIQRALGEDCVLGAFGSVVSFPGAPAQFIHRDSASLYDDFNIDVRLPAYALTILVPLVDANSQTGSTRVWPGTHREPSFEKAKEMPSESPDVPMGSVLMTDSRTLHGGSPNVSDRVRPIVYNSYHRRWYRDDGGYVQRPAVNVGVAEELKMPEEQRPFFRIPLEISSLRKIEQRVKNAVTGLVRHKSS